MLHNLLPLIIFRFRTLRSRDRNSPPHLASGGALARPSAATRRRAVRVERLRGKGHARPAVYLSREIPRERVPGPLLHEPQPQGRVADPGGARARSSAATRRRAIRVEWLRGKGQPSTYLVKYPRERAPGRSSTSRSRGRSVRLAPEPPRKAPASRVEWLLDGGAASSGDDESPPLEEHAPGPAPPRKRLAAGCWAAARPAAAKTSRRRGRSTRMALAPPRKQGRAAAGRRPCQRRRRRIASVGGAPRRLAPAPVRKQGRSVARQGQAFCRDLERRRRSGRSAAAPRALQGRVVAWQGPGVPPMADPSKHFGLRPQCGGGNASRTERARLPRSSCGLLRRQRVRFRKAEATGCCCPG